MTDHRRTGFDINCEQPTGGVLGIRVADGSLADPVWRATLIVLHLFFGWEYCVKGVKWGKGPLPGRATKREQGANSGACFAAPKKITGKFRKKIPIDICLL